MAINQNTTIMRKSLIPISFPLPHTMPEGIIWLAADIGGTKTDMALFTIQKGKPAIIFEQRFRTQEWTSLTEMIRFFCNGNSYPERMCISFAGPVKDGRAKGTNIEWTVDSHVLSMELGIPHVHLINDLEANCYGLAALTKTDFKVIYPGKNRQPGNAAVISPGTGLGEGGLYWDGEMYHPFATEGGHAHFAPRTEQDWRLFKFLSKQFGHVSWERVVSGIGICNIYEFLWEEAHGEAPMPLKRGVNLDAAAISQAAEDGCDVSIATLRLFTRYLAQEAANVAMKFKAHGGIFIGGGIIPKIWNDSHFEIFKEYFFQVGRLYPLIESVPVTLVLNQKTALLGAGYYGAYSNTVENTVSEEGLFV